MSRLDSEFGTFDAGKDQTPSRSRRPRAVHLRVPQKGAQTPTPTEGTHARSEDRGKKRRECGMKEDVEKILTERQARKRKSEEKIAKRKCGRTQEHNDTKPARNEQKNGWRMNKTECKGRGVNGKGERVGTR
ncbi:hypothetical protein C8R44DRAFT_861392 [Mycena epipterygia]|nr:hypothetical protein C8R44DRAFT_861392 [Mycena epipterygia]